MPTRAPEILTAGTVSKAPSFGNGMGQGQLGEMFAQLFAAQQQQTPLQVQAVLPTPVTSVSADGKPIILSQQSNPTRPYECIPIVLGRVTVTPYVSSNPWMSFREGDNNNDLYVGYDIGYGPLLVENIKVGDIPIDDLSSANSPGRPAIEYQLVTDETDLPIDLLEYDTQTVMIQKPMKYNDKMIYKAPQDADLVLIAFEFPSGLFRKYTYTDPETGESSETLSSQTVYFSIEVRPAGSLMSWTSVETAWAVTKEKTDAFFIAYEYEPSEIGHYEFRIKRSTAVGDGQEYTDANNLFSISAVLRENPPYPVAPKGSDGEDVTLARLAIKASANDQLQGVIEPIALDAASYVTAFRPFFGVITGDYSIAFPLQLGDEITDTSGNNQHGTLDTFSPTTLAYWSTIEPYRLNFQGDAKIVTPIVMENFDTITTASIACSVKCQANDDEHNIIFNTATENWKLYQDVATNDVTFEIGTDLELTVADVLPMDVERRVVVEIAGDTVDLTFTLSVYDADDVLLDSATDTIAASELFTTSPIEFGSDGTMHFVGQIWDIEFELNGSTQATYPVDDLVLPGVDPDAVPIFDATDQHNDGELDIGAGSWSGSAPYRLTFGGDTTITVPIEVVLNSPTPSAVMTGAQFSASFIPTTTPNDGNPIFADGSSFCVYQDPSNEDLVIQLALDPLYEMRLEGGAPFDEERRVEIIFRQTTTVVEVDVTLRNAAGDVVDHVVDSDISLVNGSVNGTEMTIGHGSPPNTGGAGFHSLGFYGQIWDVVFNVSYPPFKPVPEVSSNPALLALHLMRSTTFNPRAVPDKRINLLAFNEWAVHCQQIGYEFNAYVDQPVNLWQLVQDVAKAGRAKVVKKDGLYAPAMDISRERTGVQADQHFTRFNSSNFKYRYRKSLRVHAIRVNYLDPNNNYEQAQVTVYNDGFDSSSARLYETVDYYGCTAKHLARRYGRYLLADRELRTRQYELTTDWEGLLCSVGSHVWVSHDAALIGTAAGKIISVEIESGLVVSVTLDQGCSFETGKSYAVRIRDSKLRTILADVNNDGEGVYNELVFSDPIAEAVFDDVVAGDLFQFGEQNTLSRLLIVTQIDRMPDHAARLLLCDYNEGVHTFEENGEEIATYVSSATLAPQYQYIPPVPVVSSASASGLVITVVLEAVSTDDAKYFMVEYKEDGADDWLTVTASNTGAPASIQLTQSIVAATTYVVRARSISHASVVSDWCEEEEVITS